jgi:hypothetical protein
MGPASSTLPSLGPPRITVSGLVVLELGTITVSEPDEATGGLIRGDSGSMTIPGEGAFSREDSGRRIVVGADGQLAADAGTESGREPAMG